MPHLGFASNPVPPVCLVERLRMHVFLTADDSETINVLQIVQMRAMHAAVLKA